MRIIALLSALLLAACASPPPPQILNYLDNRFEHVAFYDEGDRQQKPLRKWTGSITYAPAEGESSKIYPLVRDRITDRFAVLSDLTGVRIRETDDPRRANVLIHLGDDEQILEQIKVMRERTGIYLNYGHSCSASLIGSLGGQPAGALVFLHTDVSEERFASCIAKSLTQVMGLTNALRHAGDTVLDIYADEPYPTEIDRRLLTILYDRRLEPGMTRDEAMPIVRRIIDRRGW